MKRILIWPSLVACAALTGCATPNQVAKPSDITLDRAINEVADSLYNLRIRTKDRTKVGLIVDEATVEFNIAASATNTATAGADLSAIPTNVGTAGLSVSNELVNSGNRGNVIKVTFKNIATADYSKGGKEMASRCARNPNAPGCPPVLMNRGY